MNLWDIILFVIFAIVMTVIVTSQDERSQKPRLEIVIKNSFINVEGEVK